jgi:hypothetical protein
MGFTKRWATALAGLVVALTALAMPSASASGETYTPGRAGSAEFKSKGEHFYVHDYDRDGHGVVAYLWKYQNEAWHRVTPAGGVYNGNGYYGAPEHRNYSIAENTYVKYEACLVDGRNGDPYSCSGWEGDVS